MRRKSAHFDAAAFLIISQAMHYVGMTHTHTQIYIHAAGARRQQSPYMYILWGRRRRNELTQLRVIRHICETQ
jgi:hypothetical protein